MTENELRKLMASVFDARDEVKDWYPHYCGEWLTNLKVRICSPAARGILVDLSSYSVDQGLCGIVKNHPSELAAFFRVQENEWLRLVEELSVREQVFQVDDYLVIPRIMKVGLEQIEKHRRRVEAGVKGGRPGKGKKPTAVPAIAQQTFDQWYGEYLMKRSKRKAFDTWVKRKLYNRFDELMIHLHRQIKERALMAKHSPKTFLPEWPHASTYLNQERWEDILVTTEVIEKARKKAEKTSGVYVRIDNSVANFPDMNAVEEWAESNGYEVVISAPGSTPVLSKKG